MKRKIKVNNQTRIELASLFGVTQRSVEYALNFERNSAWWKFMKWMLRQHVR